MRNPFAYLWYKFQNLIYPPKCVLCQKMLSNAETDLCTQCRADAPYFKLSTKKIPHVSDWTSLWYYKDRARESVLRYKFGRRRHYAKIYGRMLAMKVLTELDTEIDLVTWVTPSFRRRLQKGFDHGCVLARATAKELDIPACRTLTKSVHTARQATIASATQRRANLLGAFKPYKPERFQGKRVLLIDDIVTTGSTAGECAKTLKTCGAQAVYLVTVAATERS